jgi:hypothetical protein
MAFCNYGPACLFTPRSHASMSGDAELCAVSQQTARLTLELTVVPPRRTAILRLPTKGPALACVTTHLRPGTLPQHHLTTHEWSIQSP